MEMMMMTIMMMMMMTGAGDSQKRHADDLCSDTPGMPPHL